jgi:hypothetical protein
MSRHESQSGRKGRPPEAREENEGSDVHVVQHEIPTDYRDLCERARTLGAAYLKTWRRRVGVPENEPVEREYQTLPDRDDRTRPLKVSSDMITTASIRIGDRQFDFDAMRGDVVVTDFQANGTPEKEPLSLGDDADSLRYLVELNHALYDANARAREAGQQA